MDETLGLLGHPGGILVDHPRLRVGVVAATSRPDGLELELIARGRSEPVDPAPRVLLPRYDEGMHLRVAWLDADDRPQWMYGAVDIGTGPAFNGVVLRTVLRMPPMFDAVRLALAWPESGFPEAVVTLPLPDRGAVERAARPVWTAPVVTARPPAGLRFAAVGQQTPQVDAEAGLILAGPLVLHRGEDAVVVLKRVTLVGAHLSVEVHSLARGRRGGAATMAAMYGPMRQSRGPRADDRRGDHDKGHDEAREPSVGASIALVRGDGAAWLQPTRSDLHGGDDGFSGHSEYAFELPESPFLDLVVGWPDAGLPNVVVRLPLER